jgi:NADH-quinone oxidoreductase subunit L
VGVVTALIAASMGLVASDIKRVLAFSTVSQLGFMMTALGCGGYAAGMFHLTTHAGFKALLFLCAGSVIHAVHTNDMWKMGGLAKKMPVTAITYLVATLAIAGFPFSAGFYSKEEVLAAAFHHNKIIFGLLAFAALLTSFYMFRSWYLTFVGLPRDKEKHQHAHESPLLMTIPLVVLAIPSAILGFVLWYNGNISHLVQWGAHAAGGHHEGGAVILAASLAAFLLGLLGATWVYFLEPVKYDVLAEKLALPYRILVQKYRFDEFYLWLIDRVYYPVSNFLANADYDFLDQKIIDGVGRLGKFFSWIGGLFDYKVIDQIGVDGPGALMQTAGRGLRRLQSGLAQSYLFWMIIGVGSMLVWVAQHFK